jgi:hypothetical protein
VLRLPDDEVAIGDTWDEPFEVQVKLEKTATKMIQTRRHHKLTDVKNGVATIAVTYQVLSPIDPKIETQIVQRLMEGEVRFDIEKGRVLGQEMDVDKRIIGFAGPSSSMQYVMKMEEKLLNAEPKTTAAESSAPKAKTNTNKSAAKSTKRQTQSASRPRSSEAGSPAGRH